MDTLQDDRALVHAYLAGDEAAFGMLYERHRRGLYVYLLSIVRRRETAEELLQDTFFTYLRNIENVRERANLKPYLLRTARSRAVDFLRKERRAEKALEMRRRDALLRDREDRGAATDPAMPSETLDVELRRLPDEQRETIVLKTLIGLTFKEIGELTRVPENTAVSRYRYGLEKLRAALKTGECRGRL